MLGQDFTPLGTTEHGIRHLLLQGGALWAVTDHDQAQALVWISLLQGVQARAQHPKVFFRRQPADMQHGDIVRADPPAFAQCLAAPGRVEQASVDPAGQQVQALETTALQLQALADAGHQGDRRAAMEPAQVWVSRRASKPKPYWPEYCGKLVWNPLTTGTPRRRAARNALNPKGPSVAMYSTSGRCLRQRRNSRCIDTSPHCRPG